jgi:DNA invertase Pin-like site-specific DNA recombinase
MKEYYAYIRVSTLKQGHKGVSLKEQKDAIQRYADRKNMKIARWYEERQTAAKRGRPVFGSMLKLLRQRRADGVILHRVDRGTRNFRDWADLGELGELGVEVHIAMEDLDLSSRSGRLAADIQVVIAADFIRNLKDETRKGIYGRFKQGLYPLPAPVGYLNQGPGKPKTIDPVRGPLIARGFELYATGEYSLQRLRLELATLGLTTKAGRPFSRSMMGRILNNTFYMGLISVKASQETFQGIHKPLVDPVVFDRVQSLLKRKTVDRICRHNFTYKRLITCEKCQRFMIGELQKGRVYYRCRGEDCAGNCISEVQLDQQVRTLFASVTLRPEEANELMAAYNAEETSYKAHLEAKKQSLLLRIAQAEQRLERLTDLLMDETISRDVYLRRKKQLLLDIAELKALNVPADAQIAAKREHFENMCELAQSASLSHFGANNENSREILKTVCANFFISRKKLSVELHFGFRQLANRASVPTGDPLSATMRTLARRLSPSANDQGDNPDRPKSSAN